MNEKYVPLYRKYRPQTLEEVVGQEHIKKALANAIKLNKIAHAYLFTGPRGTGKTSSARILAKSLNCKNGPTVSPCGKCESCIDITNSTPVDVIEIDAASNRKVEDTQNILEKIQYVPVNGKYKIYIIDEVHMLSTTAFNALLKTLEEPPENVIFILATTEPQKVLDTIKSRCQRYDFKRITTEDIVNHLEYISKQERINIEKDALYTIAKHSEGGMRDSISLLDQLSVLGASQTVTVEDINSLLGRISFDILLEIGQTIIESRPQNAIEILEKTYNSGNEPAQILLNLLEFFKNLLLVKTCDKKVLPTLTQYNESQIDTVNKLIKDIEKHQLVFLIEKISNYIKEIKTSTTPHLWLEVALIDLANLAENTTLLSLQERITKLESGEIKPTQIPSNYKTAPAPAMKPIMKPSQSIIKTKEETSINKAEEKVEQEEKSVQKEDFSPMPKAQSQVQISTSNLSDLWHTLLANIQSSPTQSLLKQQAKPVLITPEKVIITFEKEGFVQLANNQNKKQSIIEACDIMFGQKNSNVIIRLPLPDDNNLIGSATSATEKKNNDNQQEKEHLDSIQNVIISATAKNKDLKNPEKESSYKEDDNLNKTETKDLSIDKTLVSDQVKMIMTLFDGKEII